MAIAKQFLDKTGLIHLWSLIGDKFADKATYFTDTKAKAALDSDKLEGKTKAEVVAEARKNLAASSTVAELSGKVTTLEGNFTEGKANDANKLEGKSKTEVIEEARTGYETADAAGKKYATKTLEGYFEGSTAKTAKTANSLEGTYRTGIINEARTGYETAEVAGTKYAVKGTETKVTALENAMKGLASATHFIGVKPELPVAAKDANAKKGDIVIVGNKEYVYNGADGSYVKDSWVELGDTSIVAQKITTLEGYFTNGKANDANKLEGKSKTQVIEEARTGYETAAVAGTKYAVKETETKVTTLEGYFTNGDAKKSLDSAKLEGKTKAEVVEEARTNLATTTYVDEKYNNIGSISVDEINKAFGIIA